MSAPPKLASFPSLTRTGFSRLEGSGFRDGEPVVEVTSCFLYRGTFIDYHHALEIVEEIPYAVDFNSRTNIAILEDKEWHE